MDEKAYLRMPMRLKESSSEYAEFSGIVLCPLLYIEYSLLLNVTKVNVVNTQDAMLSSH